MSDRVTCNEWDGWVLDTDRAAFVHRPEGYSIDFDRLLTAADIVNWIFHLNGKGWGVKCLPGFIMALDDVLDPQSSFRNEMGFTPDSIRTQVSAFISDPQIPLTRLP